MSNEFFVETTRKLVKDLPSCLARWATLAESEVGEKPKVIQEERNVSFVIAPNGIRGFTIAATQTIVKNSLRVLVGVMASHTDWRLCFSLLRHLLREPKTTVKSEEGELLNLESISEATADRQWEEDFRVGFNVIKTILAKEPYAELPNREFSVFVYPEDIGRLSSDERGLSVLQELLAERAKRYMKAQKHNLIQLRDGRSVAVWSLHEHTLVWQVELVAIWRDTKPENTRYITLEKLGQVLGSRMERVGSDPGCFYVPGLDETNPNEKVVIEAILAKAEGVESVVGQL